MKALTLHQPWASLVAVGAKRIETRSWTTAYRGPLAIHAGRSTEVTRLELGSPSPGSFGARALEVLGCGVWWWGDLREETDGFHADEVVDGRDSLVLPLGAVVAVVDLYGVRSTNDPECRPPEPDVHFGDFTPNRYAWYLSSLRPLTTPIPARGRQGLWNTELPVPAYVPDPREFREARWWSPDEVADGDAASFDPHLRRFLAKVASGAQQLRS